MPVEPEAKPAELEPKAVEPETKPTEPEANTVEPETEATEPEAKPVEPETKATEAAAKAVEPETTVTELEPKAVEPEAKPAEAAKPVPSADTTSFRGVPAFLGLDPARYTVQLARAARPDAFDALAAELGVARGELYAVPWDQAGQRTWLLFWGEFADENSARAAVARLVGAERLVGAWPRRIRAMQEELRQSGARDRQP